MIERAPLISVAAVALFLWVCYPMLTHAEFREGPDSEGSLSSHRREHLHLSLCASFFENERGQGLAKDMHVQSRRCGIQTVGAEDAKLGTSRPVALKSKHSFRKVPSRRHSEFADRNFRKVFELYLPRKHWLPLAQCCS